MGGFGVRCTLLLTLVLSGCAGGNVVRWQAAERELVLGESGVTLRIPGDWRPRELATNQVLFDYPAGRLLISADQKRLDADALAVALRELVRRYVSRAVADQPPKDFHVDYDEVGGHYVTPDGTSLLVFQRTMDCAPAVCHLTFFIRGAGKDTLKKLARLPRSERTRSPDPGAEKRITGTMDPFALFWALRALTPY